MPPLVRLLVGANAAAIAFVDYSWTPWAKYAARLREMRGVGEPEAPGGRQGTALPSARPGRKDSAASKPRLRSPRPQKQRARA